MRSASEGETWPTARSRKAVGSGSYTHSGTAGLERPDLVVVRQVAVHVRNVLAGHFFDDQSAVIGDKEATITAFGFTWGASSEGHLETDKEQARSTSFHPIKIGGEGPNNPFSKRMKVCRSLLRRLSGKGFAPTPMTGTKSLEHTWWKKRMTSREAS